VKTITLTEGGPEVSALGLGCNNFGHNPFGNFVEYERCERVVHAALDAGYAFFDTAEVYADGESEEYLGRALGSRRGDVLVATKFGSRWQRMSGAPDAAPGSEAYLRWAIDASLRRLRTDYIDLYQMHQADETTPMAETLGVLKELVAEGKIRYVGVDGFSVEQLEGAAAASRADDLPYPVSSMTHYSLLTRASELSVVDACVRLGIRIHPWFVLENGLLTGKFDRSSPPPAGARFGDGIAEVGVEVWDALDRLRAYADSHGVSMLHLAIGGIAAMPGVGVVIVGASTAEQVVANATAVDWTPTTAEIEELIELTADLGIPPASQPHETLVMRARRLRSADVHATSGKEV
jgi:1-deoxyxylulose-5-phosphate synthase